MTDINQILFAALLLTVSFFFASLIFFLFSLYQDIKNLLSKTNSVLDDTKIITNSISGPASSASEIIFALKSAAATLNLLFGGKRQKLK